MKKHYLFSALLGLLAAGQAQAQQAWSPFRAGLTYQYSESTTPGDTTHTLQLGAGARIAGTTDSLFRFNGRAGRITGTPAVANCFGWLRMRPDNLFGATLRSQPHAVFVLAAANGRSFTLRPRAAVGQSWAVGPTGLTARVTSQGVAPVLGSVPDSVVTVMLSDGQSLVLSKHYGLVSGPSLDSYLNGRNRRRALTLTALPARHLGTAAVGARAAYDFQPGDVFQRHSTYRDMSSQVLCSEGWTQDSILTRTLSRGGDSVTYTLQTKQRTQGYGSPGSPFCNGTSGTTIAPARTTTLVVADALAPEGAQALTGLFSNYRLPLPATPTTRFGSARMAWVQNYLSNCQQSAPDSAVLYVVADGGGQTIYTAGLGKTRESTVSYFMELTYYRKGSQTWGTAFRPGFFLAARATRPATTTTAVPNPFGTSLTAGFTLARPQAVAAELRDALGRAVLTLPAQALPAGAQQLALPTAGLPTGLYMLHLHFAGEGRSEVLKVQKMQ